MYDFIKSKIDEHINIITLLNNDKGFIENILKISNILTKAFKSEKKLLICGNGGSAADSQHIATEFVSRFLLERKAIDAEALTVNTSTLTAIGNDYCFDKVFSRQVESKGKNGDILLAISTSGNSKNIIEAVKAAKAIGMKIVGFTGNVTGTLLCQLSDYCVSVPSNSTARIQEAHILIGHIICEIVEKEFVK